MKPLKYAILASLFAACAAPASGDTYNLYWDKNTPSGTFTDAAMWKTVQGAQSEDFDKESNRFFRVEAKTDATNTVMLADCNLRGGLNYYMWSTASLVIDGRGAWFRQHSEGEAEVVNNTIYGPFTIRDNDYSNTAFNFEPSDLAHASTISFSNSLQRFDRTASPHELTWTLQSGRFSFAEPNGANAAHKLAIDGNGTDKVESRVAVVVDEDAEVVFPEVDFKCYSTNALMLVDGGKLDVLGDFKMDTTAVASGWRDYVCTNRVTVRNGGRFRQLGGATTTGIAANQGKRVECITVTGEGSSYEVASTAGNVTTVCETEFNILDGGQFLLHKPLYLGAGYGAGLNNNSRIVVSGAGSKLDASDAIIYIARKSSVLVEDGAEAVIYHGIAIGHDVEGGSGEDNDSPSFTIRGDDTVMKMVSKSDGQTGIYVGNCSGLGTLNIDGGTLRGATEANHIMLRIGAEYNSKGKGVVNMSGGILLIGNGTFDQVVVGFRGDGEFNLSGGEILAECPLTLNYETKRTSTVTSLFNQTGGSATFSYVDLCPGIVNEHRHSELRLDGGVFNAKYVTATKSIAAGNVATAILTANGGTLKPTASRNTAAEPFIGKMDSFSLGLRGLTLDTGAYATLVTGDIGDKGGETGLFVKTGSATLTLAGGDYTVSETRIDEGTISLGEASPVFETSLSVGARGVFSLVGSATSVTLTGLAVTNGTIALDPGDVINVSGPVSLEGMKVSFSSLPTLDGGAVGFIVCDGELDEASARAIKRTLTANAVASGAYVEFETAYDSGTGKTTVSVVHATESAPIGDDSATFWNGAGENWATVDGWTAGVPTAEKPAVFPDGVAAKSVAVPGEASAAALSFRADGYSVSGTGPLSIEGERGAVQIEVTSGSAVVGVPLVLGTSTKLPVAAGASLTLSGAISDGGLEKSGSGSLTISGGNDFFLKASFLGGMSTLANANALSGAPEIAIGGDATLAVSAAQTLPSTLTTDSTYAAPAILKADADVTLTGVSVTGALIKRGAAKVTLAPSAAGSSSVLTTVKSTATDGIPVSSAISYFPDDGSAPAAQGWAGFTVAEGEFVVKGAGGVPTVNANGSVSIGMNATNMDANAQARLTVDGATLDNMTAGQATMLLVGNGTSRQYGLQFTPTLAVVNGGFLKSYRLAVGNETYGGSGKHATLLVTNSAVYASSYFMMSASVAADNQAVIRAKDSDLLTAGNFYMQGRFDIDVDNTYVGGGNASGERTSAPVKMRVDNFSVAQPGGTFALRNGSVLSVYFENMNYPTNPIEYIWDDSEWRWAAALGNYTFAASSVNTSLFKFTMEGRGIVLKPAAGATFTTEVPFSGTGGMRNLGAGTVKFTAGTYKFTGACEVVEGATVDLSDAGTVSDAKFTGPGTVSGGMFAGTTRILLSGAANDWSGADTPTFASCAFGGRVLVDFGRTAEDPLDDPGTSASPVVVAKFTGAAPDVSNWRLLASSTGVRSAGGTFSVDAERGEVRMTPGYVGAILIVK